MKKPSLKRKKPTPQQMVHAPSPVPAEKLSRRQRRKAKSPQAAAASPQTEGKGGFRRALGAPFRLIAKPFRALGRLKGRARIIVFALLAVIVVLVGLRLTGGRNDEQEVRDALASYQQASARKDYQKLCDDLFSEAYVRQTASSGLPCEVALRTALEDVRNPTLQVLSVKVDGDKATARVRGSAAGQVPGEDTYPLVREDDAWRIQPPRSGASATP